jgi:hypothetical protein
MPADFLSRTGAAAALALAFAASVGEAQTVDDIVRRYVEARGGIAKLRSVQGLRLTGTMELADVSAPFVLELARPNLMRTEFVVQGQTGVRAFDGRVAWEQLPLPGERARPMDPDEAAEARAEADVDLSPLVDPTTKGFSVELVGKDRLPGGEAWTLLVRPREGPPRTLYLDVRSHLVVQSVDVRSVEGKPVQFVTEISDYRPLGGLVFPYRIDVGPKGTPDRQHLVIQRIEINPPLDAARFAMPKAPRAPAPPKTATPTVLR